MTDAFTRAGHPLRGQLLEPGGERYEIARRVWNGLIDRRPAFIARCAVASDVAAAVAFARERNLPLSVRGGGHNVAGYAVCDGGVMIDLSLMKSVTVDAARRTARAGPGLTWGELDRATQPHGLAVPGGVVSTTGIAGLTLGGGIGWLRRKHGLTCDSLISVEIVTADGQRRVASEDEHADLFWAVRGGGGNFGVVTAFDYHLHAVGPAIPFAWAMYPIEQARQVLCAWRDFMAEVSNEVCSDLIFLTVPSHPSFPAPAHGRPVVFVQAAYTGTLREGAQALAPLCEMGTPLAASIDSIPYLALQSGSDFLYPAHTLCYYWKSTYLKSLEENAIEAVAVLAASRSSPLTQLILWRMGGAMSEVSPEATAFEGREAPFMLSIDAAWTEPAEALQHIEWARQAWAGMQPFSNGGAYASFPGLGDEPDFARKAYGRNYERLSAVKRDYDPENVFRLNQNIRPAE